MKKNNIIFLAIFLVLLCVIFKNWLLSSNIVGGDWPFFYQEYVNQFGFLPPLWDSVHGDGLGGQSIIYATDSYLYFTGWLFSVVLHIPWNIVYKVVWYGLFLILSSFSSIFLFGTVLPKSPFWQKILAALLYTTNTYILLVAGGGQIPSANAYALAPLVIARFIILQNSFFVKQKQQVIRHSLLAGLIFSVQVLFDLRFAYITMCGVLLYLVCCAQFNKINKRQILPILLYYLAIPIGISILLHMYWILPIILAKSNPAATLGSAYTSLNSVTFFSFATFEDAIGLLHPYWPENIFGKVGFMKPEYLVLPIIAYASLFFLKSKLQLKSQKIINDITIEQFNNKYILYFALLGLIGAFLAKGANDPFGLIYLWAFNHVSGFILFRDPSKWYTLIALSYSILIPFTIYSVYDWLNSNLPYKRDPIDKTQKPKLSIRQAQDPELIEGQFKIQKFISGIFVILFIIFWLFTIRQAVFGKLNGTFAYHEIPTEYVQLKNMLINEPAYSRTLWLPKLQRFGFYDQAHPAVEGATTLGATTSADMIKDLQKKNAEKQLQDLSIKYIIVPFDSGQEIFLKDRKYNATERNDVISQLNKIIWLKRDLAFKQIAVYTLKNSKEKFWMTGRRKVSMQKVSDTKYILTISSGPADKLIFNESYNPSWIATNNSEELTNKEFIFFNSYKIPSNSKSVIISLYFAQSPYFVFGRIISLVALISVSYFLLKIKFNNDVLKSENTH